MEKSPSKNEWKQLYELAVKVKNQRPWEYMYEDQVFGFVDPASQKPCLVSVMGTLGEHLSIAIYVGEQSINSIVSVFSQGENERTAEMIFGTTQVKLSFENRSEIEKRDYEVIKKLGLKFRGKQAWPQFRGIWPSHAPFFVDQAEARLLICGLTQLREVIPLFKNSPDEVPMYSTGKLLFRVQENQKWRSEIRPIPELKPVPIDVRVDPELLEILAATPRVKNIIEIDSFIHMAGIYGRRSERGVIPHLLMAVEGESGVILGLQLLDPSNGMLEMFSSMPEEILEIFEVNEIVPEVVWVRSPLIYTLMKPFADELGIEMKMMFELPKLDEARAGLNQYMGGGIPPGMLDMMQQMMDEFGDEFPDDLLDLFGED